VFIAAAGLVGVFLLIAGYVRDVSRQVGPKIEVLELTRPLAAYQQPTSNDLGFTEVPAKWAPRDALRDPSQVAGLVAGVALPAGTELEQGMLIAPPTLKPGQREIAILVDAETGVAGNLQPGSLVDIVATFQGNSQQGSKNSARVVVPDARVLQVGSPTTTTTSTTGGAATASSQAALQNAVVPVTFALTPQQVLQVSYAESFAQKVRLSVIAPNTTGATPNVPPYQPANP
jgi:pilus assembly protein CpaB